MQKFKTYDRETPLPFTLGRLVVDTEALPLALKEELERRFLKSADFSYTFLSQLHTSANIAQMEDEKERKLCLRADDLDFVIRAASDYIDEYIEEGYSYMSDYWEANETNKRLYVKAWDNTKRYKRGRRPLDLGYIGSTRRGAITCTSDDSGTEGAYLDAMGHQLRHWA